jgi:hypothetical protein
MKKASGEKYCIKTKLNVSHDRWITDCQW